MAGTVGIHTEFAGDNSDFSGAPIVPWCGRAAPLWLDNRLFTMRSCLRKATGRGLALFVWCACVCVSIFPPLPTATTGRKRLVVLRGRGSGTLSFLHSQC